jgi:ADP-ribosylglycohydrolase
MRTAPIALTYLHDPDALGLAAQEMSAMTHHDPEAGEACALWCLAIRHAVLNGSLDARSGLEHLPKDRALVWAARPDQVERFRPADFDHDGWVVRALQGAWSAITTTALTTTAPADQESGSSNRWSRAFPARAGSRGPRWARYRHRRGYRRRAGRRPASGGPADIGVLSGV